jgi:uncharacterized repeat protein (TIGR03803 family)
VYKIDTTGEETVLYTFTGGADGYAPYGGVIRDAAGNLYGTTVLGGAGNGGVVYTLDASGHQTVLHSFTGGADGSQPYAGVIRDPAGNLYGTTSSGGTGNAGVVYKVDASGHETVLYNFTGGSDGSSPLGGVIRDAAGNLYGTTIYGGISGAGVVYKLDPSGHETVLHPFTGGTDGGEPYMVTLLRDSMGNLYGTTSGGGSSWAGVVFMLDSSGHETVLYSFTGGDDGGAPQSGLIRDSAGNLYGTASRGGKRGAGVTFVIKPQ